MIADWFKGVISKESSPGLVALQDGGLDSTGRPSMASTRKIKAGISLCY